jgi:peptidoglycan/LPS O-acetylase OafA/YrhL
MKEIDALRALAILAVLFFHAFPKIAPGGFVGVDMFFVISGFVISRSYLNNLVDRKTTLLYFYVKRIRRLAPAYIVILAFSSLFAFLLLEPDLLLNFSKTLVAQPFYLQNFLFWIEGDYFESVYSKPLLHTWSLAVEEQFYLVFGLLIAILRWRRKALIPLVILVMIISPLLGYLISVSSPKTSFYLLPTRMWELVLGITAFLLTQRITRREGSLWTSALSMFCVVALPLSVFGFGHGDVFPGMQSVIATFSIFLLLVLFESRPSKSYQLLRIRPLCYVGEISYSLYLWHWPVIVFSVVALDRALLWYEALGAIATSFVFSELTYRYIENPIRCRRMLPSTQSLFRWGAVTSGAVIVIGIGLVLTHGALFRYSDPTVRTLLLAAQDKSPFRCSKFFRIANPGSEMCRINDVDTNSGVLIIGDSHADQLDEMIADLGVRYEVPVYLAVRNCDFDQLGVTHYCGRPILGKILQEIDQNDIEIVIATSRWDSRALSHDLFSRNVKAFADAGLLVYFSESVPMGTYFNPTTRASALANGGMIPKPYTISNYEEFIDLQRTILETLKEEYIGHVRLLRPSAYLCNSVGCDFDTDDWPNYFDDHHLTKVGVNRLRLMYEEIFATMTGQNEVLDSSVVSD